MHEPYTPYHDTNPKREHNPRGIPPPQIIHGSEFDIFPDNQEPVIPSTRELATVATWLDATDGEIANGFTENDVHQQPEQARSVTIPGHEDMVNPSAEVLAAEQAFRALRAAIKTVDESELIEATSHNFGNQDPQGLLLRVVTMISALRQTTDWQPRLSRLAQRHLNDLTTTVQLADRHLQAYPTVQRAIEALQTSVERYAEAFFPMLARSQREEANRQRQERGARLKKSGLVGLSA